MAFIDWYYEKNTGKKREFKNKKTEDKDWLDLVTGTHYCIAKEDYERIFKAGKEKLEKYVEKKDLESIEAFFYHSDGAEDSILFGELPYFTKNTKKHARIRDYVCFRTVCFYVVQYEKIKNSEDPEAEKRKLRIQGLAWGIADNLEENPELAQIEKALSGEKKTAEVLERQADFVKGGIIKIKQYYLETNKIPEIRGASLLIEDINGKKMEELICQLHIRECLIYAGGGKMMGIFPKGSGACICRKMEELVERETVTAQFNFYSRPYKLESLVYDYKNIVEELDLLLEERQGLRWDFRLEPQAEEKVTEEEWKKSGFKRIKSTSRGFCTSCRNRHADVEYLDANQEEQLCQSCFYKRLAGGRSAKNSRLQEYRNFVRKKYQKEISGNTYETLGDIAENGFIGVIYGDANSMGSRINHLESFAMMRHFSKVTSEAVTEIVFQALFKHLGTKPSFEIIAIGGDDIFLIVPGKYAYDIAYTIGRLFDGQFRNQSDGAYTMTMSMGVCITHANMPVQYSFEIAQELLKSAKQKAWEERQKGNITGTIDWMVIENEAAGGADLEFQRRGEPDKPEKTLRPYTWKQAKAMKHFHYQMEEEKSFAFQLRQSWYQHTKDEAKLFYEYQVFRNEKTGVCHALKCLAEALGGTVDGNNIVYQKMVYSPWIDLVELWDYVGVWNEENRDRD